MFGRIELRKKDNSSPTIRKIAQRKQRDENLPKDQKPQRIQSLWRTQNLQKNQSLTVPKISISSGEAAQSQNFHEYDHENKKIKKETKIHTHPKETKEPKIFKGSKTVKNPILSRNQKPKDQRAPRVQSL